MAIANHSTGNGNGSGTSIPVTLAAAPAQGTVIVAIVAAASNTTLTPATGWADLGVIRNAGADAGALMVKEVTSASEPALQTVATMSPSQGWAVAAYSFTGMATTPEEDYEIESAVNPKVSSTVDPPDGVERLIICGSMTSTGAAYSGAQIGGTTTDVFWTQNDNGNVTGIYLWYRRYASTPSGTIAGQVTITAGAGSIHIASFGPAAVASSGPLPPFPLRRIFYRHN